MDKRKNSRWNLSAQDVLLMVVESLAFIAQIVLCFFFYNHLGLTILVYLGWIVFMLAMLIGWQARLAFEAKGDARNGESWIQTRSVVSSGIYGIIRHPMYLSFQLLSLTLVMLSQHWLTAIMGAIVISILYSDMCREESNTLEKFGSDYQHYLQEVPRINFIAGTLKYWRRRKFEKTKSN